MFDENSSRWIRIFKVFAIVLFCACCIFGLVGAIGDATASYLDIGLGGDDDLILDFLAWLIIGGAVGFIQLVFNMLIIQFFNNVQIIRVAVENKTVNNNNEPKQ